MIMQAKNYFAIITPEVKALPFYVTSIGITQNETEIIRKNGMEDYQLLYCAGGEGRVLISGKEKATGKGTGFFLPPKTRHHYFATKQPWKTHWLTFNGSGVQQVLNTGTCTFKITNMQLLDNLFFEILSLPRDNSWTEKSTVMLYSLLINFKKYISVDNSLSIHEKRLRLAPVIDYISENYGSVIELEGLSSLIGVTPAHLCRLFKESYSIRIFDYITRLRLQKAKELLLSKNKKSIAEIGKATGYSSPSYFCSLFKKYENITPESFKKMYMQSGN